jgi:hypothetical protein
LNRYLAAKVYYFGVQGGIRQFEEFITKTGLFKTRIVRVIDASNKNKLFYKNLIFSFYYYYYYYFLDVKREIVVITRSVY